MKDIDQFIDEQLFKNSKTYKLIYEAVEDQVKTEKPCLSEIPIPEDTGVASEYLFVLHLMNHLRDRSVKFQYVGRDKKISITNSSQIKDSILCFARKNGYNKILEIIDDVGDYTNKILSTDRFFIDKILNNDIAEINLIGQSTVTKGNNTYETSADIQIKIINKKTQKEEDIKFSVKHDSKTFFKVGGHRPESLKDYGEKTDSSLTNLFSEVGGGIPRLYKIFDVEFNKTILPSMQNIGKKIDLQTVIEDWNVATEDFKTKINQRLENGDKENIKKYFNSVSNMISRGDQNVFFLLDFDKKKSVYPRLLDRYLSNINGIVHDVVDVNESEPRSKKIISKISSVNNFKINLQNVNIEGSNERQAAEKLVNSTEKVNLELYKTFLQKYENLSPEDKQRLPSQISSLLGSYEEFIKKFSNFIDENLKSLVEQRKKNVQLLAIRYEDKKRITLETRAALFAISNLASTFEYLESNKEFQDLVKILDNLFSVNEQLQKSTESDIETSNLFESLIVEALNEKELNRVMTKISSAKPEGFVSVLPSNKTPNSLAVRFEDDESLEKGISKIKSALKSGGYKLQDERILKFDNKRDTTNVLKNGEVIAKVFYRVDIAEREGLAYEHIIGFVLTGKETDQLKNRIDLGPSASREDILTKLKSDKFKDLFKSALEAKPLIVNKVGKIVSAESVGSTNNKADFILKTSDGKMVGLSAKYATGEKDNEYKMNKVLGFGTEDDSLVLNPDGDPWWVVGRKTFLEKLKTNTGNFKDKTYDPDYESLDAPAWMVSAKEKNPDVYKETMEEIYGTIRNILTKNLKRMRADDLLAFVREADVGKDEENENYDMFVKVKDGPSGLSVTDISLKSGNSNNFNPKEVVVQDRSDIIIQIPGMQKLTINSVKFKSDMLSSKAGDLKIKTR
jgi:hypothetical protein